MLVRIQRKENKGKPNSKLEEEIFNIRLEKNLIDQKETIKVVCVFFKGLIKLKKTLAKLTMRKRENSKD